MSHTQPSVTGAYERRAQGFSQKESGDLILALISFCEVLKICQHHLENPPLSSSMDVEMDHDDIADVINRIILQFEDTDIALVQKYKAEAVAHRNLGRN